MYYESIYLVLHPLPMFVQLIFAWMLQKKNKHGNVIEVDHGV